IVTLSYLCLDPSLSSTEVIDSAYCVICMSGTLTPLEMYSDLLGFKNPIMKIYENPFPSSNRLNLVIPKTSTKFTKRSMGMYQDIARECSSIVNTIPGNTIIFFPSYQLKEAIKIFFNNLCSKTTFEESKGISKYEKEELLENFKREKDKGSVLLAVIGGSFSIDSKEEVFIKMNGKISIEKIGPLVDRILSKKEKLDLEVPSFDSNYKIKFRKVNNVIRHITNQGLVEISLATNRKVKTTLAHSVFTLEEGKIQSKRVSKLKENDYLVIPGRIPTENTIRKLDILEEVLKLPKKEIENIYVKGIKKHLKRSKNLKDKDYRNYKYNDSIPIIYFKEKSIWKKDIFKVKNLTIGTRWGIKIPRYLEVNKSLARLLGYYVAEGHCRFGRHSDVTLSFGSHEKKLHKDTIKCICEVFGFKPIGKKPHPTEIQYSFGGKITRLIFNNILKIGHNAKNKKIPWLIFQLSEDYKKEFLKGYFAGDGTGCKSYEISCKTSSKKLASDLMYLFLQLKIFASMNKVKNKERELNGQKIKKSIAYNVYVSNIDQTSRLLDVVPEKHLKKLKKYIKNSSKNKKRRSLLPNTIPIKESNLLKLYKEANPSKPRSSSKIFSRIKQKRIKREFCSELLNYIKSNARNKYDKTLVSQIKKLINSDLGFVKVKKIKKLTPMKKYVYDFSVKNYENFIGGTGGVCLHNSEGIDLPGDLLKGVVVVGLPLGKPNLETTELINYFDSKYSKGWDYAYIFPAMQKTMQAAGRCIRTENDKGVIVFLDERYSWNNYFKCFPPDYNINVTMLPLKR
ncbi:MAG TPA: helicase C-terminal domain-containing protein, partial [Candidatus Nanoarchaeia archaeon]|nr:helicase C-terminal domain-containing protein [Candidatus Nanoarchaeia archaeon]